MQAGTMQAGWMLGARQWSVSRVGRYTQQDHSRVNRYDADTHVPT